jgi:glycosyltransferase involved in cell wall biosynthesis
MSPRGCLEAERLKRSARKKRLSGWLFDRRYLKRATVLHATCQAEAEGIVQYLLGTDPQACNKSRLPPVVVIPNGIDTEAFVEQCDRLVIERKWRECGGKHRLLFLSRIHPIKGLDLLVSAWELVASDFPNWHLLVAGPDEQGHEKEIRRLVQRAGLPSRVTFCGPLYGEDRSRIMASADLFVLPTRNENFGIVVAEALYCGVPVVTTKGAPWQELETNRCGWWVDIGVEPLADALREAMCLTDEERRVLGQNGRRLVETKYQWTAIAKEIETVYEEIVSRKL